jgi:HEPN superfamily RiboL-PSP-like protein
MPSNSLSKWRGARKRALDEIVAAHVIVGGTSPGRRYATQQINYSYATLLSSHFQGFCRDLHSECIDHIVAATPPQLQVFLRIEFVWNRSLDKGNPHPGSIGSDFNRLGIQFWPSVDRSDTRNPRRRQLLQELIDWRNAIAHQDFGRVGGNPTLHLTRVRAWRNAVAVLAIEFDRVMQAYLSILLGAAPW